jgi:hypothetical protein
MLAHRRHSSAPTAAARVTPQPLVEATDEAHLRYAKLPVDHWVHPWSLSAIKARTSYALEVALTLRGSSALCQMGGPSSRPWT